MKPLARDDIISIEINGILVSSVEIISARDFCYWAINYKDIYDTITTPSTSLVIDKESKYNISHL